MRHRIIGLILVFAVAFSASGLFAHQGDSSVEKMLLSSIGNPSRSVGDANCTDLIQKIVTAAGTIERKSGVFLLPPGSVVDSAKWNGTLLEIEMTLAEAADNWILSSVDMSALSRVMSLPYLNDDTFAGVDIRARRNTKDAYISLAGFVPEAKPPVGLPTPDFDAPISNRDSQTDTPALRSGGGSTSASRQPAGALSGVVVYISGGHGWTAGASSWALQRPLQNDMVEDYGNLDQINYVVQFAQNAGATVVPLRPVGWQPIEIVLDNDDPGVTFTGSWSDSSGTKYFENGTTNSGVPYRFSTTAPAESATARFAPTISTSDFFPVYAFAIAGTNRVRQMYRVSHSGGLTEVTIDHREVGNGWVWLGEYYFEAGGDNYVEVSNQSQDAGIAIADAIRFGGGAGDISRPGPGTTSGYPRDEECQRYWAEGQLGNNAVGFDSGIWDVSGLDDVSDNVGAGARIAREMNQVPAGGVLVDRWKRVHVEFHTNAATGSARGQLCLITNTGSTTNQTTFATTLSNEIDADLSLIDGDFEHLWIDRASPTLTGSYGAISTGNNSDEFDSTLVELAFHDNEQDAELLRDPSVRRAMARASVQGIVRFLNSLPGSQVPLAFLPDTPREPYVEDLGGGDVRISWSAPLADGARGDAATGYVVYQSSNGYGFGNPIVLGNVTSTVVSGVPIGETRYFRVAATNAGGESMPTEVLAIRRPDSGFANVLIVSGFDRLDRFNNRTQTFTQPPAYAGQPIERQQWRRNNSYDYVVQHAEALAANNFGFTSASNEAVANQSVDLNAFDVVAWILGTESVVDSTFDAVEQARVSDYLANGGAMFVSGSNVAFDLIAQSGGASFAQNSLRIGFSNDNSATTQISPSANGLLNDLSPFDFSETNGAAYAVPTPDRLLAGTDALSCLNYVGGIGGIAGIQYTGPTHNVVTFGFPFETISNATVRADVIQRVMDFLINAAPLPFDFDEDGDVDSADFSVFQFCFLGPDNTFSGGHACLEMDGDIDFDVDLRDFAEMQVVFTGS